MESQRPVVLITGLGRRAGVAAGMVAGIAERLASEPAGTSRSRTRPTPYGASKGALDRIVLAGSRELGPLGVTANAINPGPIDTGWMTDEVRAGVLAATPLGRPGSPSDTAALVAFLLSADGRWINGLVLHSDGGFSAPG